MNKIYFGHPRDINYREIYEAFWGSVLASRYEFIFPHSSEYEEVNTKDIITKEAFLFIAEVSTPATGLGIEIGYAAMAGTPVLCIHKVGSKIASSLKYVTSDFIEYDHMADMVEKVGEFLRERFNG